ncbi:MAG: M48 family metalloprotease [Phycisphaerales bacterium]|nr:M48 family metalloprotease [Phycisphaerales bacterium]
MVHALLIAAFLVVLVRDRVGPASWARGLSPDWAYMMMVGAMGVVWALAQARIALLGRSLDQSGSWRAVQKAERTLVASRLAMTAALAAGVVMGALDAVRRRAGDLIVIDELLTLAPLLVFFVLGWWSIYPIERRVREAILLRRLDDGRPLHSPPSRAAFVGYATRHQMMLIVVPIVLIMAWQETAQWLMDRYHWPRGWWHTSGGLIRKRDVVVPLVQGAGVIVVFALLPLVLRYVWDTVRLGPGSLRDGLVEMCRAHRVRVRDLLVWRTGGQMLNGAVMGIVGPARYILLTDALLESMTPEQVEAVTAHEVGHVRRRHMVWLAVSVIGGVMAAGTVADLVMRRLPLSVQNGEWAQMAGAAVTLAVGLVLFGYVSRRFEWQADAFAVQHLSGLGRGGAVTITPESVGHMNEALQAVADLNHIPVGRWTWRHGSIRTRQRKLAALVGQPAARLAVDRQARAVKWAAAAVLAASVAMAAYDFLG